MLKTKRLKEKPFEIWHSFSNTWSDNYIRLRFYRYVVEFPEYEFKLADRCIYFRDKGFTVAELKRAQARREYLAEEQTKREAMWNFTWKDECD